MDLAVFRLYVSAYWCVPTIWTLYNQALAQWFLYVQCVLSIWLFSTHIFRDVYPIDWFEIFLIVHKGDLNKIYFHLYTIRQSTIYKHFKTTGVHTTLNVELGRLNLSKYSKKRKEKIVISQVAAVTQDLIFCFNLNFFCVGFMFAVRGIL